MVCNGSSDTCDTRPGSMDGVGVDADIIVIVGTTVSGGICSTTATGVIAFASSCQLENTFDRYVSL